MPQTLIVLLVLFLIVAVIAVVGHGIWVLASWIFGGTRRRAEEPRRCVFCQRMTPKALSRCDWCGRDLGSPLGAELSDLEAVERQLRRFRRLGALKPAVVENLLARVERYRKGLLEPPQPRPAAPAPAPFEPPVAKAVPVVPVEPQAASPARPQAAPRGPVLKPPPTPGPKPEARPIAAAAETTPRPPAEVKQRPTAAPRPKPEPQPPAAPPPKKSWAEMLAGFMEERNIRWGELVCGLLIVGFSIGLVLSLWETLKDVAYFPFLVFATFTSAVFGVGLYAHYRWKVESTSRTLLVIATLLVPLNFLAMAGLSEEGSFLLTLLLELASLGIFAWLLGLAGRVLVPEGRWLQALAVVGSSAGVVLVARRVGAESADWWLLSTGCLPVACLGAAIGGHLYKLADHKRLEPPQANGLFTLLGSGAFALLVALGLLVFKRGNVTEAFDRLSVLVALAAVPVLACGLTVIRRVGRDAALAAYHTAGTAIALVAMTAMLVALGLAWPHPVGIIAVGTVNAAALIGAAFYYRLPVLHAGAIASAALVYLTMFHVAHPSSDLPLLARGANLGPKMLRLTLDASSGTALAGLFVVLGGVAEWLARRGRHRHGAIYAGGSAAVAVVGLVLVTWHGVFATQPFDPLRAAILYAIYGAGSLGLVARWLRVELSYLGLGLLAVAPLWALWWHPQTHRIGPLWATGLAAEALLMGCLAAILHLRSPHAPGAAWSAGAQALKSRRLIDLYRVPLLHVAELLAPAALALGVSTAWFDRALIYGSRSPWPVLTVASLAGLYFLLAWGYRSHRRTWAGSLIVLAGLVHTLRFNCAGVVEAPWLVALLAHSSLAVLAAVALDLWTKARSNRTLAEAVGRVLSEPLGETALLSSAAVLLVLPFELWAGAMSTASLAVCLFWLAAIWLVIAWRNRDAVLFAAHQAVLALAAVVGTTVWLEHQAWVANISRDWFHPHSLQAYGITLAVLSLAWVAARILLWGDKRAGELLNPNWPAVDWVVRHAVLGLQFVLAGWFLLPGIADELVSIFGLSGTAEKAMLALGGGSGWLLLGLLAVVLVVSLWQRWRNAELVSTLLLAATVPCLMAGGFVGDRAVASALRWGLAGCFVVCSLAVWARKPLVELCRQVHVNVEVGKAGPRIARATLLATTALPVLTLTIFAALLQFAHVDPGGPAAGTFFERIGESTSYVVPLLLVVLGLVGHAVRERSAGYAFSAGLVTELIVVLGYALHVTTTGDQTFDTTQWVWLIQLATITTALWAGAWLLVRQWLNIWREETAWGPSRFSRSENGTLPFPNTARLLMNVQLGLGAAGNLVLIGAALVVLGLFYPFDLDWKAWIVAVGRPLGWIALVSVIGAYAYRTAQIRRQPRPEIVGLLGMTLLGLLACTVEWRWPGWGYRTLMLGWAVYALFIVSATWWVAGVRTLPEAHGPPQGLIRAAAVWVRVAGILAVLLGLKAAFLHVAVFGAKHEELLWAAAAIAVASAAGATMAVWRRQEGWAFSAALGVNLAASLVVWYFHRRADSFGQWWLRLIQANVIASSAVALVWLAVRRRLYQLRELTLGSSPLLGVQTALPVIGNFLLLIVPVLWLVFDPANLRDEITEITRWAEPPGWLGLLLAAAAGAWYLRQVLPGNLVHVLGGLGLGAGVLLACYAASFTDRPPWNAWCEYHTLVTAWTAVGVLLLVGGILGRNLRLAAEDDGQSLLPKLEFSPTAAGRPVLPSPLVRDWVTVIGALVVLLAAIHSAADQAGVWWYLGAILAVSVTAGTLAVWLRQAAYVYASGLLLNLIGIIAWVVWGPGTASGFVQANVLCLAVGSGVWSLLRLADPAGVPHPEFDGHPLPYAHLAARVAVGLLAAVVAIAVICDAFGLYVDIDVRPLDWHALAATAVAVAICLWDRGSRWALPGLYVLGLLAIGMGLCAREIVEHEFCHAAAVELAGFVLVATVLGRLLPLGQEAWRAVRIPEDNRRWPADWFPTLQGLAGGTVAALSVWISIDSAFEPIAHRALGWLSGPTAGPLALLLLLPAAVLLAGRCEGRWRGQLQYAALGLGFLILSESGFVWLMPGYAPWLHRSVILMVAGVAMTLLAGPGLRQFLPGTSDWIAAGRRAVPVFGGLAVAMLALILLQEAVLFDWQGLEGAPLAWPGIVVVAVALAALVAGCLGFAVVPKWDPLRLSDRGRTAYVYAAEGLAALVGLHLWLTVPDLFRWGIMEKYWMLIVMAVAFAGAGLSEWFHRRKLPVLSEPLERTALLLPAAPAIAAAGYWLVKDASMAAWLRGATDPTTWFLMGLFYGFTALSKRSLGLSALAIFTGNMGLWVLLDRVGVDFRQSPQLWLIPLALAVLVAEYLDRGRLSEAQRTSIRYVALSVIYLSSTTDFMRTIGDSVWLPLVTILLSVFGVLAGMLLRVRSFLYLGTTFVMVVILRLIYHLAFERGETKWWIVCTCGILLGAGLLLLLAFFEKRRNDIRAAMERFKQWQR